MTRIFSSPGRYVQGRGELDKLAEHYRSFGSQGAYLIVGGMIDERYHERIIGSFERSATPYRLERFDGECCQSGIERLLGQLDGADAIVGIGGGKVLDTAKAVAHYARLPVVIVPTAASSDAPCSRLSVLYTEEGKLERYLTLRANPDLVLVDTQVIAEAPARFLAAGMGDALSTYYEARACAQSGALNSAGGHAARAALALAGLCRDILLADGEEAMKAARQHSCTPALENVIEANIYLSGVGFESGGLAAAHAIHNGLVGFCRGAMHGEIVAFCTVCMLLLEHRTQEELDEVLHFCRRVGLPLTLSQLGLSEAGDGVLLEAARAACADPGMGNMPRRITPEEVLTALHAADSLGRE